MIGTSFAFARIARTESSPLMPGSPNVHEDHVGRLRRRKLHGTPAEMAESRTASEQTQPAGLRDRRRPRRAAEFSPDVRHVPANGVPADHELLRDLLVGEPVRDEREHVTYTPGQQRARLVRRRFCRRFAASTDDRVWVFVPG